MKIAKTVMVAIIAMMLVTTVLSITPTTMAHSESNPMVRTLYAGQTIPVGTISVWNDETNIHVDYHTTGGWVITGTHLYVGKTNPKDLTTAPGQFPYSGSNSYTIALSSIDGYHMRLNSKGKSTGVLLANGNPGVTSPNCVFIAAHADVKKETFLRGHIDVVSDATTKWTDLAGVKQNAVPCWVHPSWATVPGATWIWRTALTDVAWEYANVPEYATGKFGWLFEKQFSLPSSAYDINGHAVVVNSDNSYEVFLNNAFIGGEGTMAKDGPDNAEWGTLHSYSITPVAGSNVLAFRALNYFNWGDSYSNPAGLAFAAEVCYKYNYQCQTESAWADGCQFSSPNWAMYFKYCIQGWEYVGHVHVLASNPDPTISGYTFANGELYKLKAKGTADAGDTITFDAKYSNTARLTTAWTDSVTGYESYGPHLLDLKVNGNFVNWGAYSSSHEYTYYLTGTGTPATFGFQTYDIYPVNNAGELIVDIFQWM